MFVGYNKRFTLKYVKERFEKEGYSLLSTEYINREQKLEYVCPRKHNHSITWRDFRSGSRCPYCYGNTRKTIEEVRESFEKEGYTLLSKEYLNNRQKLDCVCPEGHRYQIAWTKWQTGTRCFYCFGKIKKTFEEVKRSFENEGCVLISKKYVDAHQNLDYICSKGHNHSISWSKWHNGTRCIFCGGRARKNIKEIRKSFHKEGYILLITEYKNCDQKLKYICPKGHKHQVSWDKWKHGRRCSECSKILMKQLWTTPEHQRKMAKALNIKPNKPETQLLDLLNQLFPDEYKYVGDFQFFLGGKNPDFMNVNHQKKLIECFGQYWHKDGDPQERIDHFRQFGFDTLIVWENELKDRERLMGRLQKFHNKEFKH